MNEINALKNIEIVTEASNNVGDSLESLYDLLEILEKQDNAVSRIAVKAIEQTAKKLEESNLKLMKNVYYDNGDDERNDPLSEYRSYFDEDAGTWYDQAKQAYLRLTGFTASNWDVLAWTTMLFNGYTTADYLMKIESIKKKSGRLTSFAIENGKLCSFGQAEGYNGERIKELLETNMAGLRTPIVEAVDKKDLEMRKKAAGLV